ncbi:hypothetical protein AYO44_07575 [Planctomycetaceae bacterium SCGC AG-212-F19]|nr:hypothetical protein AYO44_07575 [Planctomycetaceae bacterium SCGC AG-212-F19]
MPTGKAKAPLFEEHTAAVFERIFNPHCIDKPRMQVTSPAPNHRRDIILPIVANGGVWHYWAVVHGSDLIMVECKNYAGPIGQDEVESTVKYLRRPGLSRLAFIVSRKGPDTSAIQAAREIYRTEPTKLLVFLSEQDLIDLLRFTGKHDAASLHLRRICQEYQLKY